MLKVTEDDWKEYNLPIVTNKILATLNDLQPTGLHLFWIAQLYKLYRLGAWHNKIPNPEAIADKTYLMWENEEYCLFHRVHEKFGKHILECAHPYGKNIFVFFDYQSLYVAFEALDNEIDVPYIPIYHAHPHDRYDYKNNWHEWGGD